ncbi:hypothetical protein FXE22_04935 [Vibrio cholerae]|uniref:hypothetical protein n=1 Tax=Vibrio cholerae TaxID=666 RepID=UPI0011D6D967|nr:hypothetical protein [Vibrio cholerae]TXZ98638.1 hypothetical protein FXE22_04935 [Vibrio cholerae]
MINQLNFWLVGRYVEIQLPGVFTNLKFKAENDLLYLLRRTQREFDFDESGSSLVARNLSKVAFDYNVNEIKKKAERFADQLEKVLIKNGQAFVCVKVAAGKTDKSIKATVKTRYKSSCEEGESFSGLSSFYAPVSMLVEETYLPIWFVNKKIKENSARTKSKYNDVRVCDEEPCWPKKTDFLAYFFDSIELESLMANESKYQRLIKEANLIEAKNALKRQVKRQKEREQQKLARKKREEERVSLAEKNRVIEMEKMEQMETVHDVDIEYKKWHVGKNFKSTIEKLNGVSLRYSPSRIWVWIGNKYEKGFKVKAANVKILNK